jgi:hypothetical protein
MATGRIPTTANSPLTVKGDLFGYSTTQARVPVGNDGETLVADSSTSTGLRYQGSMAAGRNGLINGGMDIWQRGTTSASITTSLVYTSDRWVGLSGASTATVVSRQTTSDTTNLPNVQYCARVQRTAGQTGTSVIQLAQSMESVNSVPFAGKAVTLSFYARAGANYSAASSALNVLMLTGTGTDQQVLVGYTGSVSAISSTATLTTTWQRFSFTATLATNTSEIGLDLYYTPVGTAGANDYFEVTGIQLELGSVATNFSRAGGNIQGELAACRYYYRRWTAGTAFGTLSMFGTGLSSTQAICPVPIDSMRTSPSAVDYANINAGDGTNSYAVTALSINQVNNNALWLLATTASGLVQYRPTSLVGSNNVAGYVGLSAEL